MAFNYKTEYERYRRYYQAIEPIITKPTTRVYTTAIFSFLAISLFGWYAIRPTLQTILFLRREIADNTLVNQQMEDKITNLIQVQSVFENVQDQLPVVEGSLPQNPDVVPLVAQLRNLAAASQASLSAVQVSSVPLISSEASPSGSKPAGSKLVEVPITVIMNGPYDVLRSFITRVVEMRRIVTIDGLTISPAKDNLSGAQQGSDALRLVLKLKTYYLVQ